jgi:hypothetical protein
MVTCQRFLARFYPSDSKSLIITSDTRSSCEMVGLRLSELLILRVTYGMQWGEKYLTSQAGLWLVHMLRREICAVTDLIILMLSRCEA